MMQKRRPVEPQFLSIGSRLLSSGTLASIPSGLGREGGGGSEQMCNSGTTFPI